MRLGSGHLTYCMNVHPGESLEDTLNALRGPARQIKGAVGAQHTSFGVGLRIAGEAARELQSEARIAELQRTLVSNGMYAFTVNAFPYGAFHGRPVKQGVYLPDWSSVERVVYTRQVAQVLRRLLPPGVAGTISTVPLGYGTPKPTESQLSAMVANVLDVVGFLREVEQQSGACIRLALEPEPDCVLQTTTDVTAVFDHHFYSPAAVAALASRWGVSREDARELCARHLGVCLDTCHAAVEFEAAADVVDALRRGGVNVCKVQLSSGLRVEHCDEDRRSALARFDEAVYLHQVVVRRRDGNLVRYPDLGDALRLEPTMNSEWRVHFHVPLHVADYSSVGSTREFVEQVLLLHREVPISEHLEVETYTWDVLPERPPSLVESISQELVWVMGTQ